MSFRLNVLLTLAVALAAACGGTEMADPASPYMPGFNPPPPAPEERVFVSPVIKDIKPGTDITICSYLDERFDTESDVTSFRVFQGKPGHHMLVYAAKQRRPAETHPCTEDDMVNSRFLAGSGGDYTSEKALLEIPPGLAFRVAAGAQIMIQTHWINAGSKTLDGQGVAYFTTVPSSPNKQTLDLFNVFTSNILVPAGQSATITTACPMKRTLSLYTLTGHQHEWGSRVEIKIKDDPTSNMLWAYNWLPEYQSNPPYNRYSAEKPLVLSTGQTLQITCTWKNDTQKDLRFPSEMCVASGFYFPANGEINCEDGVWSGG